MVLKWFYLQESKVIGENINNRHANASFVVQRGALVGAICCTMELILALLNRDTQHYCPLWFVLLVRSYSFGVWEGYTLSYIECLENCFQRNSLNLGGEKRDAFRVNSGILNNYSSRPNGLLTQRPWGRRNNCYNYTSFSKIQLVGKKYRDKNNFS